MLDALANALRTHLERVVTRVLGNFCKVFAWQSRYTHKGIRFTFEGLQIGNEMHRRLGAGECWGSGQWIAELMLLSRDLLIWGDALGLGSTSPYPIAERLGFSSSKNTGSGKTSLRGFTQWFHWPEPGLLSINVKCMGLSLEVPVFMVASNTLGAFTSLLVEMHPHRIMTCACAACFGDFGALQGSFWARNQLPTQDSLWWLWAGTVGLQGNLPVKAVQHECQQVSHCPPSLDMTSKGTKHQHRTLSMILVSVVPQLWSKK
ncbi:hypothetical protein K438DRAFT_1768782 [Mycena galopus ATCC 62051]|nr:hypothetical protein K438DRAFT_1768782 [Mycena galopus ATCC 62051]